MSFVCVLFVPLLNQHTLLGLFGSLLTAIDDPGGQKGGFQKGQILVGHDLELKDRENAQMRKEKKANSSDQTYSIFSTTFHLFACVNYRVKA